MSIENGQAADLMERVRRVTDEAVTELVRGRGHALLNRVAEDAILEGRVPEAFPGHRDVLRMLRGIQGYAAAKANVTAVQRAGGSVEEIRHAQTREANAWDVLVPVVVELATKANR